MKIQATRKMMKPKRTSFISRRRLVKRLVKHAVSRAAALKKPCDRDCDQDHEVEQRVEGRLVPGSYGVFVDGDFVPLTSGFLVNSGTVPYYLPVVDNHGFLLGQFSKLDDLSILEDESPHAVTSFIVSEFN
jgi:hypothetical protein